MTDVDGSAPAGNPEPTVTPEPTPTPTPTPTPEPTPSVLDGFADAELRTYAEGKGFDKAGFEGVVKSYSNLEKMMSAEKQDRMVILPTVDSTPEDKAAFFGKLGRPNEPKGYELPTVEGQDSAFSDWAAGTFHTAGLSKDQAASITEAWQSYMGEMTQQQTSAVETAKTNSVAELKKEWGAAFDQRVMTVDATAQQLDMTDAELESIGATLGAKGSMDMFLRIAGKIGDDTFDTGEVVSPNHLSPAQAKDEMSKLMASPEWADRMHPSHKATIARKSELARMMTGLQG